jgi:hypothetical protein
MSLKNKRAASGPGAMERGNVVAKEKKGGYFTSADVK